MSRSRNFNRGAQGGGKGTSLMYRSLSLDHDLREIERGRTPNPLTQDAERLKAARAKVTLPSAVDAWLKKEIPE